MGRGLLAVLLRRSFRRRSSTLPASAALRLVYGQPVPERPGVAGLAHSRSDGFEPAKSPWGTAWVFAAAGLMAFSTSARVTASPLLEKEEATVNGSIANGNHGSTANGHHGSIANGHHGSIANGNHGLIANGNHGLNLLAARKPRVVFVLGGPGSGKGTQCAKVVENYGFEHLSAGDLLRAEINSGSENGTMIQNMIKEGKIVPSEVTVKLIQKAMEQSKTDKFLIDGFPRNEENRAAFESVTGIAPEFILFFDCPEDEMERRLLQRNQGRVDDNIETIRKRFKVFVESSLPVVEYYESIGKVRKINATRSVEEIFNSIQPLFKPFVQDDLLQASQRLLDGIDRGDYEVYSLLCDPQLTAFEPESKGQLVEGLPFHKYYFDQKAGELEAGPRNVAQSTICAPKITTIGNVGLVTYTRLVQKEGKTKSFNETRVWERRKNSEGVWEWRNIHFHRSSGTVV